MLPEELLNIKPPATLEEALKIIQQQQEIIRLLLGRIEELEERLNTGSGNSSTPPSQDSPKQRAERRKKPKSSRAKGAQRGHPKHQRALWDEGKVDVIERYYPPARCACGGPIEIAGLPDQRHQIFDLPEVKPTVIEHQRYSGVCQHCGSRHKSAYPDTVPSGQMGPGLISWISLLNGGYRLSLRQVQRLLEEQWGLAFSLGAISESQGKINDWLQPVYAQIGEAVRQSAVAHADETSHYRNTSHYWLWVLCTEQAVYMLTHYSRGKTAANELLADFDGVLVSDRHGGYNDHPDEQHQYCWAHVIRNLEKIAQRKGDAGLIGERLVRLARLVFRIDHAYQRQIYSQAHYRSRMERVRNHFQQTLQTGIELPQAEKTVNQCQKLLQDEPRLWTFLKESPGVIPLTNNTAERAIRPYVIWRKTSFFSQSYQGDQFRPMILSVLETCKRQTISGYGVLRKICTQGLAGKSIDVPLFSQRLPVLPA
jgi:hypothetical protein